MADVKIESMKWEEWEFETLRRAAPQHEGVGTGQQMQQFEMQGAQCAHDVQEERMHKNSIRRKLRQRQNALVFELDVLLPEEFRTKEVKNGAGSHRSLGTSGRSLFAVLADTVECLKVLRARERDKVKSRQASRLASLPAWVPPPLAIDDDTLREGMRSSHFLALMEVDMPGWTIENLNTGAQELLGRPPWVDSRMQCLVNTLVHRNDVLPLQEMWQQSLTAMHSSPKILRMCSYKSVGFEPMTLDDPYLQNEDERMEEDTTLLSAIDTEYPLSNGFLFEPYSHASPRSPLMECGEGKPHIAVPLMQYESMHAQLFAVSCAANFDALEEKPGGTQCSAATRMLLVGSRLLRPSLESDEAAAGPASGTEVLKISREDIYATGIFKFDWSSMEPASNITPGMMREAVQAHMKVSTGLDEEEVTMFGKMWQQLSLSASWCMGTLLDFSLRWLHIHVNMDCDENGVPFICIHSRLDVFGFYHTPWKLKMYAPFDGSTQLAYQNIKGLSGVRKSMGGTGVSDLKYPVKVDRVLHFPEGVDCAGKKHCAFAGNKHFAFQELWLCPISFPEFPSVFPPTVKEESKEHTGGMAKDRGALKESDKTKKRKGEKRRPRSSATGGDLMDPQLFSLRIIEWSISPCRNWIWQSGFLHGSL
jgi:hypothetical protein